MREISKRIWSQRNNVESTYIYLISLIIQRTNQKIAKMEYKWGKMTDDVRQMFYGWEFWIVILKG